MVKGPLIDLPPDLFPITFLAFPASSKEDRNPLWQQILHGPARVRVNLDKIGQPFRLVVRLGDGTEDAEVT